MRKSSFLSGLTKVALLYSFSSVLVADENHSADAVFGRGLNTAQPGNPVNHIVIPTDIRVKAGGVVDFTVAGFHDIVIFEPGFTLEDLKDAGGGDFPTTQLFFVIPPDPANPLPVELAFLNDKIFYRGINPAGGPLGTAGTTNPSNSINRAEVITFPEKGTYLVICNVRPHLLDGMFAYVRVN